MATVEVGTEAPDFELRDSTGQPVKLSDYRGKKAVVLVFYPFAFSGICHGELCSVRDEIEAFRSDDVETLAVSADAPFSLKAWAAQEGYEFPLLSDWWPHGAAAKAYGVFNEQVGAAERGTFVIDRDGIVRFAEHNGIGEARDHEAWKKALTDIGAL
ncbi:MAG: peroxiredoxin [Actinomycetes bacterium]